MTLEGYMVVPPVSSWDKNKKLDIWLDMGYTNFGKTPAEAWRRFIGPYSMEDVEDRSAFGRKVQFWFDRGYRIKKATIGIYDEQYAEMG